MGDRLADDVDHAYRVGAAGAGRDVHRNHEIRAKLARGVTGTGLTTPPST